MRAIFPLILSALAVVALAGPAAAQERAKTPHDTAGTPALVEVVLADGSELVGRILDERKGLIRLELTSGDVIELQRSRLREVRPLDGRWVDGTIWRPDPNATRLFFAPTGRSIEQGRGYLSVYEVIMPFLAVGVTDRITVAGGTPLIFGDSDSRVFWLAPKVQVVRAPRVTAAVGALHFLVTGPGESIGIAYAVATFGSRDQALTTGLGLGYSGSDLAEEPVVMLGGEVRASRSVKLITENYVIAAEGALVSGGLRFFGERLTADLGLIVPVVSGATAAFPLVNFVYNW